MLYKIYGMAALVVLLVSMVATSYWYMRSLNNTIQDLKVKYTQSQRTIKAQSEIIATYGKQIELQSVAMRALQKDYDKARKTLADKNKVFQKHNLKKLMLKKPTLVSKYMQRGTNEVLKELEEATK